MNHSQVPRPSRWPICPRRRLERAKRDLDFIAAVIDCGCADIDDQLGRIYDAAIKHSREARREIEQQEARKS